LATAFKLLHAAQERWRAVNSPHLVALVRAGARFDKGVIVKGPDEVQQVPGSSEPAPTTIDRSCTQGG
jgi:putative transposase